MNLHYQYYWFKEVIPHDVCDKLIKMGNEQIELVKKEGGDRLWKAIVQGFAYCQGTKSKRMVIVAQDEELKSDMINKIRGLAIMAKHYLGEFSWDYYQYQYLQEIAKKSKNN